MNDTKRRTTRDKKDQCHLSGAITFLYSSLLFVFDQWIYMFMFTHTLTNNSAEPSFVIFLSFFFHRLQSEWNDWSRIPILSCISDNSVSSCICIIIDEKDAMGCPGRYSSFVPAVYHPNSELGTARKYVNDMELAMHLCPTTA